MLMQTLVCDDLWLFPTVTQCLFCKDTCYTLAKISSYITTKLGFKNSLYDVRNGTAPSNILNLFTSTSKIHPYNTRFLTSNKFHIKKSRLEIQQKAVSRIGAKVWNELPASLRELTKKQFKKKLRIALIEISAITWWLHWCFSDKHSTTESTILNSPVIICCYFYIWS